MGMKILAVLLLTLCSVSFVQAEDKPFKEGLACPVKAIDGCEGGYCSGKVKGNVFAEHADRKVYFCCRDCVKSFEKNPDAYLAKVKEQWEAIDEKKE